MSFELQMGFEVRSDRLELFDDMVLDAIEPAVRSMAQEYLKIAEERVESQRIPGPPLSEATVRIEEWKLAKRGLPLERARRKWQMFNLAVGESFITTTRQARGYKAEIMTPPGTGEDERRPRALYRLLEFGGDDPKTNKYIPPRPLWTTIIRQDTGRLIRAFGESFAQNMRFI